MNARGIRARGAVVVLTLLTLGATACGSRSAKSTSATQPETSTIAPGSDAVGATSTTTSGGETTTTAAGGAKTGHVGDTLINPDHYVPADVATVTLVKIIDPATQFETSNIPDPGKLVGTDSR